MSQVYKLIIFQVITRGKQLYLWITIQNEIININFSGSRAISGRHPGLENNDANIFKISVSDSPFTIQRGFITKNIYDVNSDAYGDVREYEISEGTYVRCKLKYIIILYMGYSNGSNAIAKAARHKAKRIQETIRYRARRRQGGRRPEVT